ncbi:MAG: Flp pilus assembly protein CpaB [Pseudomonadota bacterium]
MNVRSIMLIAVALVVALVTAFFARSLLSTPAPVKKFVKNPVDRKTTQVLVAAKPLSIGHLILPEDYRWQAWPEDAVDARYITNANAENLKIDGKVVRYSILPGDPISTAKLIGPGQRGFLAAVLKQGMRAVTVPINQTSGIAGFIFPGDRVDLILTHEIQGFQQRAHKASETVLRNVRVLAVDQRTNEQANKPSVGSTVTLEVSPKVAEKIAVVMRMGGLSLSLRSLADREEELVIDEMGIAQAREAVGQRNARGELIEEEPSVPGNMVATADPNVTEADLTARSIALKPKPQLPITFTWDSEVSTLLPKADQSDRKTVTILRGRGSANTNLQLTDEAGIDPNNPDNILEPEDFQGAAAFPAKREARAIS